VAGKLRERAQVCLTAVLRSEHPTVPTLLEHTGQELNALLGTMSFWARLSARQRDALVADTDALHQRIGQPIRSSTVACLVTARRAPRT
jgi:hypothetical protein